MPLQNRVTPTGDIIADTSRGLMMGNRGGRIHDPATRQLHPTKRWLNRQWICCVCDFKDRRWQVMGKGYTELFFLDEVTALAAGHRPCFECRRTDAEDFAEHWRKLEGLDKRPLVKEMDEVLHRQRLQAKNKATYEAAWQELPDGAMIKNKDVIFAKKDAVALRWFSHGYERWPKLHFGGDVSCLTPPMIVAILKSGYKPHWHPSAD